MNENRFFATFFFWGGGGLKRELERHCSFIIMVNKNTIRVCEAEICILNSDILYIDSDSKREQIFWLLGAHLSDILEICTCFRLA